MTDTAKRAEELEEFYNSLSLFDQKSRYARHLRRNENESDEDYVRHAETGQSLLRLLCGVGFKEAIEAKSVKKTDVDSCLKEILKNEPDILALMDFERDNT